MKWQPIETAPRDGTELLLFVDGVWIQGRWYEGDEIGWWDVATLSSHGCGCCASDNGDPTGWMPLPEPPNA